MPPSNHLGKRKGVPNVSIIGDIMPQFYHLTVSPIQTHRRSPLEPRRHSAIKWSAIMSHAKLCEVRSRGVGAPRRKC
jgi:hypothetical protein